MRIVQQAIVLPSPALTTAFLALEESFATFQAISADGFASLIHALTIGRARARWFG
jgi:hypothetical protein